MLVSINASWKLAMSSAIRLFAVSSNLQMLSMTEVLAIDESIAFDGGVGGPKYMPMLFA